MHSVRVTDFIQKRIRVVGAGVIGLTTALELSQRGYAVVVSAKAFSPETTSDVAGAIWYPSNIEPVHECRAYAIQTLQRFYALSEDTRSGVTLRRGRRHFYRRMGDPWWQSEVQGFSRLHDSALKPGSKAAFEYQAPVIDASVYLRYLRDELQLRDVSFEQREIITVESVFQDVEAAVLCVGLGAIALLNDTELSSARGQTLEVRPPFATDFELSADFPGGSVYAIPRHDCTIVGGVTEKHSTDLESRAEDSEKILRQWQAFHAVSLPEGAVIRPRVGLRPSRRRVRLEILDTDHGPLGLNYGHSGAGFTLSWGCASAVADRLIDRMEMKPVQPRQDFFQNTPDLSIV